MNVNDVIIDRLTDKQIKSRLLMFSISGRFQGDLEFLKLSCKLNDSSTTKSQRQRFLDLLDIAPKV